MYRVQRLNMSENNYMHARLGKLSLFANTNINNIIQQEWCLHKIEKAHAACGENNYINTTKASALCGHH